MEQPDVQTPSLLDTTLVDVSAKACVEIELGERGKYYYAHAPSFTSGELLIGTTLVHVSEPIEAEDEYEYPISFQLPPHLPSSIIMYPTGAKNEDFEARINYIIAVNLRTEDGLFVDGVGAESDLVLCQQPPSPSRQETSLEASATVPAVLVHRFDRGSFEINCVLEKNWFLQREMIRVQCTIKSTSTSNVGSIRIALVRDVELRNIQSGGSHGNSNNHSKKASKAAASSHNDRDKRISKTIKQTEFPGVLAGQEAHTEQVLKAKTLKKPFFPTVESHFITTGYRVIVDYSVYEATSLKEAKIEFPVTISSKIATPKSIP